MPKLPRLSGAQLVRALKRLGFATIRQRGSHLLLKKSTEEGEIGCVVPMHRELATGTLHGILHQAKVTPEELREML